MTGLWQSLIAYAKQAGIETPLGWQVGPVNYRIALHTNDTGPPSATITHLEAPRVKGSDYPKRRIPGMVRTSNIKPYMPTDTAAYVLGLATKAQGEADARAADKQTAYRELLDEAIAETDDAGLIAIRSWLDTKPALPDEMISESRIEFTVDGVDVANSPDVTAWWASLFPSLPPDTCTVCGEYAAMTDKLPRVKGVGGQSGTLASANSKAGEHYGRSNLENIRICVGCSAVAIGALNALLDDPSHSLKVGEVTYVWWMLGDNAELDLFDVLTNPDADTVRRFLDAPHRSKVAVAPDAAFALVGLIGKQGRIAVRSWEQGPASRMFESVSRWLETVTLTDADGTPVRTIDLRKLASAVDRTGAKDKNKPGHRLLPVLVEVAYGHRSVLPPTVLGQVLDRICAEGFGNPKSNTDQNRAALLRLIIDPPTTHGGHMATDTEQIAYHLGRMLARYDTVQYRSNKSQLAAKSMRAMLAQPAKTFALLTERLQPHLAKTKGGHKAIASIAAEIATEIPVKFSDTEKAQFCLGFWQEKNTILVEAENNKANSTTDNTAGDNQ